MPSAFNPLGSLLLDQWYEALGSRNISHTRLMSSDHYSGKKHYGLASAFIGVVILATPVTVQAGTDTEAVQQFLGRWDITLHDTDGLKASWIEITHHQDKLIGRLVWLFGSVVTVPDMAVVDGELIFELHFMGDDLLFRARPENGKLTGLTQARGHAFKWTGEQSPPLLPQPRPQWDEPMLLFNGHDLEGWVSRNEKASECWSAVEGVLANRMPCVDLISRQTFKDFKIHVEFKLIEGTGSGIYLRGRYEVQIQNDFGKQTGVQSMGAVFGFIAPSANAAMPEGEWQCYDITLIGRRVTVVLNGQTIIHEQDIPGITGGARDSREGDPGPVMLQGDHGRMSFRNIIVTPAKG